MSNPSGQSAAEKLEEGRKKLVEVQDACDNYDGITNSTGSNTGIINAADAASILNGTPYEEGDDEEVKEQLDILVPNLSEDDTVPEVCEKVDKALFATNAFVNKCPTVSNFKYDSIKCDPGYWCGCSDPSHDKCEPSNDIAETFWAGHYTEYNIDPSTNESQPIVYTGWATKYPSDYFQCDNTLYCPGQLGNLTVCPKLCKEGNYCPTSSEQKICPEGSYCRTGSTEPTECTGLERCVGTGISHPSAVYHLILAGGISLVAFGCLLLSYRFLNKKFPFRKKKEIEGGGDEEDSTSMKEHITAMGEMMRQPSILTTPRPSYTIDVKFSNLQLTLPNGICIMQGVTGELTKGQFTAIMGPSGAGKSTFLSLLSGKTEPTGGTLSVNGEEASLKDYRNLVGFVPQEDIMLRELTVEENIRHSAFMRLPSDMSHKKKLDRVYKVMESLDLLYIRNSIIGNELVRGISGGQRKRVNVAMELVADPSLLALDEPTSGLDSTTSSNLCETLSQLAATGVNVAAVIHQPKIEILEKFTNVLLLGVGGKTVYMGPAEDMATYFETIGFPLPPQMNPADYYMDVIAGLIPCEKNSNFKKEDLFDIWATSLENSGSITEVVTDKNTNVNGIVSRFVTTSKNAQKRRKTPGIIGQIYLLFKRAVLQRCRVPQNTFIPLCLSASAGILIGFFVQSVKVIYYGIPIVRDDYHPSVNAATQFMENYPLPPIDQTGNMWLFTALAVMLVCIVSVNTFGQEKAVFRRESFSGTKATSYWFSKTLEAGIWLPLYAAVFVTVCSAFQPQPIPVHAFWLVVWMAMIGDSGIGHIVSLVVGPTNRGIVHMITCLVLIMIFSGVMIKYQGKKLFQAFFTFWVAQGYAKGTLTTYDNVYRVEILNSLQAGYNLDFPFGFDILCAFLTAIVWHLVALMMIVYRSR